MNRVLLVKANGEQKIFSSLKKVCENYNLNYHTLGKRLRQFYYWTDGKITIKRLPVE